MGTRPKILLVIPHLGGGGAERVVAHLAGGLNPERFDVHLGLVTQRDAAGFALPVRVTVHGIGARRVRGGWWGLLRLVWRLKPDVILSGMAHLNMLLLMLRPLFPRKTRVLVRQNGCMFAGDTTSAYRKFYPRADAVVCQTAAMAADLGRMAGLSRNLRVLPNPVDVKGIRATASSGPSLWSGPGPHLLAVGRLAPEKGFDLLLQAFAQVRKRFPSADLTIVGEGRERRALEMLAWLLGVRSAVRLAGQVEQPAAWFPGSHGVRAFIASGRFAERRAGGGGSGIADCGHSRHRRVCWTCSTGSPVCGWLRIFPRMRSPRRLEMRWRSLKPGRRFPHRWVDAFSKDRAIAAYEALHRRIAGGARAVNHIALVLPGIDKLGGAERQVISLARGLPSEAGA